MTTLNQESIQVIEKFLQEEFFDGLTARLREIRRRGCVLYVSTRSDFADYHQLEVFPLDKEGNPPADPYKAEALYSENFDTGGDEIAELYKQHAKDWLRERGVKVYGS